MKAHALWTMVACFALSPAMIRCTEPGGALHGSIGGYSFGAFSIARFSWGQGLSDHTRPLFLHMVDYGLDDEWTCDEDAATPDPVPVVGEIVGEIARYNARCGTYSGYDLGEGVYHIVTTGIDAYAGDSGLADGDLVATMSMGFYDPAGSFFVGGEVVSGAVLVEERLGRSLSGTLDVTLADGARITGEFDLVACNGEPHRSEGECD